MPSPTCLPGQGGSRKGMRPIGNETGRTSISPPRSLMEGFMLLSAEQSGEDMLSAVDSSRHGRRAKSAIVTISCRLPGALHLPTTDRGAGESIMLG
jgi:hypothetical protein